MTRPIWKGFITFGLVSIPVTLFTAVNEASKAPAFHFIDRRNKKRVKNMRINEETGDEVPWEEIVRGYEYEKNKYVILSDEDFEKAAVESNQVVNIEDFVEQSEIRPILNHKPYYLVSDKKGEKGYVLLREILKKTNKAGIARVVVSKRQYLSAVIPQDNALVLELLLFNEEIKPPAEFEFPAGSAAKYKITESEMDIALKLIGMMSTEFRHEKYRDDYTDRLYQLINKKIKQPNAVIKAEKAVAFAKYDNFMDILKKSVEQKEMTGHSKDMPKKGKIPEKAA